MLIKVCAASVNAYDWRNMRADPFLVGLIGGLFRPKNPWLGFDIAGRVEAVGRDITQFRPGDEVYSDLATSGNGAFAEYVAAPEHVLVLKPANLSFEQTAAVPMAAVTALQGLRDAGKIQPGHKVLINGASDGVGTFVVQIAKYFGAEVTAVCSTRNIDMVRFAMVVQSRVLPYPINRWANLIAGVIAIPLFIGIGPKDLDDMFFATIEVVSLILLIWFAWKWPNLELSVGTTATGEFCAVDV